MMKIKVISILFFNILIWSCGKTTSNMEVLDIKPLPYIQAKDSANKYYLIGLDKAVNNQLEEALINLDKAISFQTDSFSFNDRANFYQSRGLIKSDLRDNQGALEDLNKSIEYDSLSRSDTSSVLQAIDIVKLVKQNSKFVEGGRGKPKMQSVNYGKRAIVKSDLGDYLGAMKDYNRSILIEPGYSTNYLNRGILKVKLGDLRGAIQDFNKAIELKPDFTIVYNERGRVKMNLNEIEASISDFNKAIELDPKDPIPLHNRGIAKFKLNDVNGACLDWSKAGENGYVKAYELIRENCN